MLSIKNIGKVTKRYRHLIRYQQIIGIIFKYGFENILEAVRIDHYIESGLKLFHLDRADEPSEKIHRLNRNQRIRMALEELGPTFVKMGQVLSSRPDLVPLDLIGELEKLQDNIPSFGFDQVTGIILSEFGKSHEVMFDSFDPAPFASASIGQVHQATIQGDIKVAVKVQRPGIKKTIEADLEIMHHLASILERNIEEAALFRPVKIVEEFAKTLEKELDYTIEAANMERMGGQFAKDRSIHIPKTFPHQSSERVLTMEFIQGIKADNIKAIDQAGLDRKRIMRTGADFTMKQVFEHGFFHADPHPGNIFVLEDGRICPVDFGMTGYVDQTTREIFVDLIHAIGSKNFKASATLLCSLAEYDALPDMAFLEKDLSQFVSLHLTKSLKDIKTTGMLNRFLELCSTHGIRIPPDLFLMMKAFICVEGLARKLDPDFNMIAHAVPYVEKAKFKKYSLPRLTEDLLGIARESLGLFQTLPADAKELLRLAKAGKLHLDISIDQMDRMMKTQDQTSNRISFSIIIAALILGSAIVVNSDAQPLLFGFSVIGIAGFIAAAVMGIWLLVAIIRRGRL